jgi:hypothetical protein
MNEKHLLSFITAVVSWGYSSKEALYYVKDYLEPEDPKITDEDIEHMQDFYFSYSKEIYALIDEYGEDYEYMEDEQDELTKKYFNRYMKNLVESE